MEKELDLDFLKKNLVVTVHPQANRKETTILIKNLIEVLKKLKDTLIIFTGVNPDINSDLVSKNVNKLKNMSNVKIFKYLGQNLYLSLIKQVDCMLQLIFSFIEAPYLKIPTVNIGSRQDGRPFSYNIVNTDNKKKSILKAINKIYSYSFRKKLRKTKSFYFKKNSTNKIMKVLRSKNLNNIKEKRFENVKT